MAYKRELSGTIFYSVVDHDLRRLRSLAASARLGHPHFHPDRLERAKAILGRLPEARPEFGSHAPLWARLRKHQGGDCYLCAKPLHADEQSQDHVIPQASGVGPGHRNKLAAHKDCNVAKGSRWPTPCELLFLAAVNMRLEAERLDAKRHAAKRGWRRRWRAAVRFYQCGR